MVVKNDGKFQVFFSLNFKLCQEKNLDSQLWPLGFEVLQFIAMNFL